MHRNHRTRAFWAVAALVLASGCERRQVGREQEADGVRPNGGGVEADAGRRPEISPPLCTGVRPLSTYVTVGGVDAIDLLFVVDNSRSMADEQLALTEQFPGLLAALTDASIGLPAPARSVHLGVVSTDMGVMGVPGIDGCSDLGGDGVLQSAPSPLLDHCRSSYPTFLAFEPSEFSTDDSSTAAIDLACIARLGTDGCGFPQPLEAALKALWPADDDRVVFGGGDGSVLAAPGHGTTDNAGFLRGDTPEARRSVLAIVLVSDKDDCSVRDLALFGGDTASHNAAVQCALHQEQLFDPTRYTTGLRALRPNDPDLLLFAAIVGVPPDLVDSRSLAGVVFSDPDSSEAFYRALLDHPAMQTVVDTHGTDDAGDDSLSPSCSSTRGPAVPPARIVEVARSLGESAIVQSICNEDFAAVLAAVAHRIGTKLGEVCLPQPIRRGEDGLIPCQMLWSLPPPDDAEPGTPTECGQAGFEFLLPAPLGENPQTGDGGARCLVAQLEVAARDEALIPIPTEFGGRTFERGWFYDDFSREVHRDCPQQPRRVAFSTEATPPHDVLVTLKCAQDFPQGFAPECDPSGATTRTR